MTEPHKWQGAAIASKWWRELTAVSPGRRGVRRASLARLRRAKTPLEVIQESAALRLIKELPEEQPDRVAILAGILAFVTESDNRKLARAIGRDSLDNAESALMSEGRFRRLLQVRSDELMDAMRRLVRLTKGKANVYDVSFAVLRWGEGVKKRWIFDYYNVSPNMSLQPPARTNLSNSSEPNS